MDMEWQMGKEYLLNKIKLVLRTTFFLRLPQGHIALPISLDVHPGYPLYS